MIDNEKPRAGFDEMVAQQRATNVLLAALLARGGEFRQQDVIAMLSRARLSGAEIAAITGTTINTVQVTLSRYRRTTKKPEAGREG